MEGGILVMKVIKNLREVRILSKRQLGIYRLINFENNWVKYQCFFRLWGFEKKIIFVY